MEKKLSKNVHKEENKKRIDKLISELFENKKLPLHNMEALLSHLPCHHSTFYDYYPTGSDERNEIQSKIELRKAETKSGLRVKMYNSNSAADHIALYKLLGTAEEREVLGTPKVDKDQEEKNKKDTVVELFGKKFTIS